MLAFFRRIYSRPQVNFAGLRAGGLRQALAETYGRAEPRPGDWLRLRRRAEAIRWSPRGIEPLHRHYGALAGGSAAERLAFQASGMAWRLPWRSSLAACPLF